MGRFKSTTFHMERKQSCPPELSFGGLTVTARDVSLLPSARKRLNILKRFENIELIYNYEKLHYSKLRTNVRSVTSFRTIWKDYRSHNLLCGDCRILLFSGHVYVCLHVHLCLCVPVSALRNIHFDSLTLWLIYVVMSSYLQVLLSGDRCFVYPCPVSMFIFLNYTLHFVLPTQRSTASSQGDAPILGKYLPGESYNQ